MGVGAAIAAGNQAEKGIWALLVIAAKINKEIKRVLLVRIKLKLKEDSLNISAIAIRIATSPIRFLITVSMPALAEDSFW